MSLSRGEMFGRMGILQVTTPAIVSACEQAEEREWRNQVDETIEERGVAWHTSFHASSFPGDDDHACGRKALYELMNIPDPEPFPAYVSVMGVVGKAMEMYFVEKLHEAGTLMHSPREQMRFEVPELWLAGSVDGVHRPPGWNRGHVLELKGKDGKVVEEMKYGGREYDPDHRRQLLTYIGMANAASKDLWPDLAPITTGSLLYFNRAKPLDTHEWFFSIDHEFLEKGSALLKLWKQMFIGDVLPDRPKEWRWTEHPCDWCSVKKLCKKDVKEDVKQLSKSNAVKFAKSLTPLYDYEAVKKAVIQRWEKT